MLFFKNIFKIIFILIFLFGAFFCDSGSGGGTDLTSNPGNNPINNPGDKPISDPVIFEYEIREQNGIDTIYITGFSDKWDSVNHANIEIPEKIEGSPVKVIESGAFKDCTGLKSVIIPDSVVSISKNAFQNCDDLESVEIGNGVRVIGYQAFYACRRLKSIVMGASVTLIADRAFEDCMSLESITIPETVTSIGFKTFRQCANLTSIVIPDSVEYIGNIAFEGCFLITTIKIGKGLKVFRSPNGSIDWESDGLQNAFIRCSRIESIEVDPDNEDYSSENGVLFSKDKKVLLKYPMKKPDTQYTIPDTVETIAGDAFCSSENLLSVTIPDSVVNIGKWAFLCCRSLQSISIPDSVTNVTELAFMCCESLTSVEIGKSFVPELDEFKRIFLSCDAITEIKVSADNDKYSAIKGVLFSKNKLTNQLILSFYPPANSRTDYIIPDGVESVYESAFRECNNLTSLTIGGDVNSAPFSSFFYAIPNLQSINVSPDNQTFSSNNGVIFSKNGTKLIRLVLFSAVNGHYDILNTVNIIDERAFAYLENLNSVTIPGSVTSIGNNAFYRCENLGSITIPGSVTSIGDGAFTSCTGLSSITIPNSVTSIGSSAFKSCVNLKSVTLSNSITEVSSYLFHNCESLEAITIPDSVTKIGNTAFSSCIGLRSITIPALVTEIGFSAFYGCENLDSIILNPVNPPKLENVTTFKYNAPGRKIYVPAGSVDTYKNTNYWSDYADDILSQ